MCLAAAQHIIDEKRYAELDIPAFAIEAIEWAWNNEPPALYGRFDVAWAGAQSGSAPKLLEYNADTPTSLLEAAVVQWHWLNDMPATLVSSKPDQFNSIHEKLIAKWKDIDPPLQTHTSPVEPRQRSHFLSPQLTAATSTLPVSCRIG
jgi:glutathionylspermidine synthase